MPAGRRHIGRPADREPHISRRVARLQSLLGSAVTEIDQNEVVRDHLPVAVAELIGDGLTEFAQPHR